MIKRIYVTLLILMAILSLSSEEIRAVWATSWEIDTPHKIDNLVRDVILHNQNTILAEVRYRADALYTPNKTDNTYYNPDPKSYLLEDKSFDALQYLLDRTKGQGIEVHAWLPVYVAAPIDISRLPKNHIYFTRSKWFTNQRGKSDKGLVKGEGYFLDPGNPFVQDYIKDGIMDIVVNYPELNGIHLDYFRYPGKKYGYNADAMKEWKYFKAEERNVSFNEWKILQLNLLLKELQQKIKHADNEKTLSVAVVSDYDRAVNEYSQRWIEWLDRGYVDYVYPMVYSTSTIKVSSFLGKAENLKHKDKIVVGLRAFNGHKKRDFPLVKIEQNIFEVRDNEYAGISLFSYGDLLKKYFGRLKKSCYNDGDREVVFEPIVVNKEASTPTPEPIKEEVLVDKKNEVMPEVEKVEKRKPEPKLEVVKVEEVKPEPKPVVVEKQVVEKKEIPQPKVKKVEEPERLNGKDFNIVVKPMNDKYSIVVTTDVSCHIEWKIKATNGYTLYSKYRWYPKGKTIERWDGQMDNSEYISAGDYTLNAFSEIHRKSIIRKLQISN